MISNMGEVILMGLCGLVVTMSQMDLAKLFWKKMKNKKSCVHLYQMQKAKAQHSGPSVHVFT